MIGKPCLNPNCKSHGVPHPNCRCYGEMAKGGEVEHFCAKEQMHKNDCEYYAEGGAVEIDPNDVVPDQEPNEIDHSDVIVDQAPQKEINQGEITPDKEIHPNDVIPDSEAYSTPGQQAATIAEGAIQGVPGLGPLVTAGEVGLSKLGVPGISAHDISARAEANPGEHLAAKTAGFAGSMYSGLGELGGGATLGATALNSFLLGLGSGTSDEATNWITGQMDPNHPVASSLMNIGASGLFNLAGGTAGFKAASKLSQHVTENIGSKLAPFLEGVASAAKGIRPVANSEEANIATKVAGAQFYDSLTNNRLFNIAGILAPHAVGGLGSIQGAQEGYERNGIPGAVLGGIGGAVGGEITGLLGKTVVNKIVNAVGKNAVAPFIAKILSSGSADGIGDAINYAARVSAGQSKLSNSVENIFSGTGKAAQQGFSDSQTTENRDRQKLKDYIGNGGYQQNIDQSIQDMNQPSQIPQFAEGGEVSQPKIQTKRNENIKAALDDDHGVALHFPAQHTLLVAAKSRVGSYLNSMQPQTNLPRLAFDKPPDNTAQERSYNRALDIANNPLSVLDHIAKGTIEPEHIKHLNALYPEATSLMQKKITEKIIQSQLDGNKPPLKVRQGLSLFMGTPLSGELTPSNMQAAQAVFQTKKQSQGGGDMQKPKKNTGKLSNIGNEYLTSEQARQKNSQKG